MLTIFTHCKAFTGHIGVIQRNAIRSWMELRPRCQIILCGDREGTKEAAQEFGLPHLHGIAQNEYGTPFLNDLFDRAQALASHDLVCYTNSDIIFFNPFLQAVATVARLRKRFLVVGECWDLDIPDALKFEDPSWERHLSTRIHEQGRRRGPRSIDYFVFPRGFYKGLPPFVLGTAYFDNWLVWKARSLHGTSVDISRVLMPAHQNHDYSHIVGGYKFTRSGENAKRNLSLTGGRRHIYLLYDTSHRLEPVGLRRNYGRLFRFGLAWEIQMQWWWALVELTRPVRHALGLNLRNISRFRTWLQRKLQIVGICTTAPEGVDKQYPGVGLD